MPNCTFYAYGDDHRVVIDYVLSLPCDLYDMSPPPNTPIAPFKSISEIEHRFNIKDWSLGSHPNLVFQIYSHDAGGKIVEKKLVAEDGATFSCKGEGWGLIQLYLGGIFREKLRESHTNHNTQKRATKWEQNYPELGDVNDWDFSAVTSLSRKLNRFIRKVAVRKTGSRVVMDSASRFAPE